MTASLYCRYVPTTVKMPFSVWPIHAFCHSVTRSNQPFTSVWTNVALEQSVNLDCKSKGGIIGISKKHTAVDKWFLMDNDMTSITTRLKAMAGYHNRSPDHVHTHKEETVNDSPHGMNRTFWNCLKNWWPKWSVLLRLMNNLMNLHFWTGNTSQISQKTS